MWTMTAVAPATRSEWAEDRLRQAILRGEFRPGQRLHASDLAERWDVSATPLREAFQRLAGEGLVELLPQRGARVSELAADEAARIYELRLLLEPLALRQSIEASDDQHRGEIRAAFAAFSSAQSTLEGVEAHAAFHRILLSRCPSIWLLRFTAQLADASRLYQVASVGSGDGGRHPRVEHEALRDAAISGDIDACVGLQEQHLRRTLQLVSAAAQTSDESRAQDQRSAT
jgi:GntR family transcriptional regulator, carbon starvation induced regulator